MDTPCTYYCSPGDASFYYSSAGHAPLPLILTTGYASFHFLSQQATRPFHFFSQQATPPSTSSRNRAHLFQLSLATGHASLLGWQSGISWDGTMVSPLLSDTCPHMLVLLHRATPVLALSVSVQAVADDTTYQRLLSLTCGADTVTLDHNMQVRLNKFRSG